jgi:hypothetical protein
MRNKDQKIIEKNKVVVIFYGMVLTTFRTASAASVYGNEYILNTIGVRCILSASAASVYNIHFYHSTALTCSGFLNDHLCGGAAFSVRN